MLPSNFFDEIYALSHFSEKYILHGQEVAFVASWERVGVERESENTRADIPPRRPCYLLLANKEQNSIARVSAYTT